MAEKQSGGESSAELSQKEKWKAAEHMTISPIAHMQSQFREKFGIPRQSGVVPQLKGRIVFEEEYRDPNAFRGLEEFSHIWIIWQFSRNLRAKWSPTVQPPRLGGNTHMGVFATRSPFRPNAMGLSCVRLERVEIDPKDGPVLIVSGADLMDGTPIYDIKPYISYADFHPDAVCGFADAVKYDKLEVDFPPHLLALLKGEEDQKAAVALLEQDPRPHYQDDPERRYGMAFAGWDIRFHVIEDVVKVIEMENLKTGEIFR